MFVVGSLRDKKLSPFLVYLRDASCNKLVIRTKVTKELQIACWLLYLKRQMTNKAALMCSVVSDKDRTSMLDQEEEKGEVQIVFNMGDLSDMSTHLDV